MVLHTLTYSIFQFVVSQFTLCIYQSCANLKVSREYCKCYSSISVKDNEMRKCWRKSEFWGICSGYTCKGCLITLWTVWQIFRELVWLINMMIWWSRNLMWIFRWCTGTIIAIILHTLCQHRTNTYIEKQKFSNDDLPWLKRVLTTFEYPHYTTIVL